MKVGDTVRILPRTGSDADYSFYYTDVMEEEYAGKTAKIVSIVERYGHTGTIPDDGQMYLLDIDAGRWQDVKASEVVKTIHDFVVKRNSIKKALSELKEVEDFVNEEIEVEEEK